MDVFIVALVSGSGEVDVKGVFKSRDDAEENIRDLIVDFGFCATHDGEYDIVIYERPVHRTSDVESHHYSPPVNFVSVDPE